MSDTPAPSSSSHATADGVTTQIVGADEDSPATPTELAAGTRLGRYVVMRPIGSGGMGIVYLADDPELDRRVAVKLIRPDGAGADDRDKAARRLQREAQAIARLTHPSVVAVYDVGESDGGIFVAMEYVDGTSLRRWLGERERTLDEILDVFLSAGRGLAAAHAAGIVHRDVKPDNILVDAHGVAKVLDFGLARAVTESSAEVRDSTDDIDSVLVSGSGPLLSTPMTMANQVMGTPSYMAPEQLQGLPSPASDQYALCITLYEAVYERRPFKGRTVRGLMRARRTGLEFPSSPRLPRGLKRALAKGLAPDPGDRFASIDELLKALRRLRTRRVRTALWVVVASAASAAVSFGYASSRHTEESPCARAGELDTWDDATRLRIETSLEQTGSRLVAATWPGLRDELDGWASAWSAARRDVCEATLVRGKQTGAVMDQRNACLERQRQAFDALVGTLATADVGVVANAQAAAARLPSADGCADPATLALEPPLPRDEPTQRAVLAVRRQIADATALRDAGRYVQADDELQEVVGQLDELDYDPLRAEYHLEAARLLRARDEHRAAEASLRSALQHAEIAHYPALRLEALLELAFVLGGELKQFAAAKEVLALAEILSVALGDPPQLYARRRFAEAELLLARDEFELARPILEDLLTGDIRVIGRDVVLSRLAQSLRHGQRQGIDRYEEALAIAERKFGPHHPRVADVLAGMGGILIHHSRDWDETEAILRRALDIRTDVFGARSPAAAAIRSTLGVVDIKREDFDAAAEHLEFAVAVFEEDPRSVEFDGATVMSNLGIVYSRRGDQEAARGMHQRALQVLERADPDHPRRVIPMINIALTHVRESRDADAIVWYERAVAILETRPEDRGRAGDMENQIAAACVRMGDNEAARLHFRRALDFYEQQPGEPKWLNPERTRLSLAVVSAQIGDHDEARRQLERALADATAKVPDETDGTFPRLRWALADALWSDRAARERARGLAETALRQAQQLRPDGSDELADQIRQWLEEHPAPR